MPYRLFKRNEAESFSASFHLRLSNRLLGSNLLSVARTAKSLPVNLRCLGWVKGVVFLMNDAMT